MNKQKFDHLLACYGANLERWPEAHRDEANVALTSHPAWQNELSDQASLDDALDDLFRDDLLEQTELDLIEQQILAKTVHSRFNVAHPTQDLIQNGPQANLLDRLLAWVLPSEAIWKSAIAACLPVLLGLTIGLTVDFDEQFSLEDELTLTGLQLDAWEIIDE